ncbi:MAG: FKBP-type peptidyl-prolyl cis-trans isomerase [Gemmatimonadota bacterium]
MTSKITARLALAAAGATVLAGCLDTTEPDPSYACGVSANPTVAVAGDTVRAENGLKYIAGTVGDTARGDVVQNTNTVEVCYVGFFPNGQVFDRGALAADIPANQLIPGFLQGIVGMREGGTRRLIIPPALGYGSTDVKDRTTGAVVIPANSTIVFDVGIMRIR